MPTGEAAHPDVTSMGTWCKLGKQMHAQLSMSHIAVKGPTWVPTPSTVRHGTASCGLLVLPQEGIPALTHST